MIRTQQLLECIQTQTQEPLDRTKRYELECTDLAWRQRGLEDAVKIRLVVLEVPLLLD